MWFTKRGKNGVSAWSWLTAAVNLTQPLKSNNEWWGRCCPIHSLSVEAFQLVNSALTFSCAAENQTDGSAQWKQVGITVRWSQIKTRGEQWPTGVLCPQCLPLSPRLCWEHPGSRRAGNVPVEDDERSPSTLHKKQLVLMWLFAVKNTAITAWPGAQPL